MNSKEAIRICIDTSAMVCSPYLEDLTDEDMMRRPHPKCNHLKWQVGHLVASEHEMINGVCPGIMPELPEGFAARYSKEAAASDDPAAFDSKAELMRVHEQQRAATLAALDGLSEDDLASESPEPMRGYAPNVAAAFSMQGSHWMMHAGQWVIVRRQIGRDPLF